MASDGVKRGSEGQCPVKAAGRDSQPHNPATLGTKGAPVLDAIFGKGDHVLVIECQLLEY
jgi:hypothetical protein